MTTFFTSISKPKRGIEDLPRNDTCIAAFLRPLRVASVSLTRHICDHTGWVWPSVLASETHGAEWTWTGVQSDLETTGSPGGVGGRNSHKPHPAGDDVCCLCSIWCPGPSHQSPGLWPWASVSDSVFWRRL